MIEELRPYGSLRLSGDPWLGSIPTHWSQKRLSSLGTPRVERNPGDLPLLSVFLDRGVIRYEEGGGQVHAPSLDLSNYQVVHPGDFVLNNQQAWRGSVGISKHHGIISPAYIVLRLNGDLLPEYANYLFRCPRMVDQFVAASKGVGDIQRQVFWPFLRRVTVPLPGDEEQRRIVRFLDYANRQIVRAIRAKKKLIALLNEQRQTIIHHAVTRGLDPNVRMKDSGVPWLGKIPVHWDTPLNQRIFKEEVRSHYGRPEVQLSLSQRDGLIARHEMRERSLQTSSFENWKLVVPGDLVLNRFKAHLGVFFSATLRGIVSFHYGVFAPRVNLKSEYFELLFHTSPYRAVFAGRSNGMTVGLQNLSNQNFYSVRAVLPPNREQEEIVAYSKTSTAGIAHSIDEAQREISLLGEYRTTLITDVVTGQRDVRDAGARLPVDKASNMDAERTSEEGDEGDVDDLATGEAA